MLYKAAMHGVAGALLLLSGNAVWAEDGTLLSRAGSLIAARDYAAAYALLEPVESENSGNPDYDMLLGLAAIDSGHVTRGVFALERVLAVQPDNSHARAQIARAYFLLGEQEAARTEFRNVLNQRPPEDMTRIINRYMSAIDKAQGLATTFSAYLEGTVGHDSNVNSATGVSSVAVPLFGGQIIIDLDRTARETSDNYMNLAGGVSFRTPLANRLTLFAGINASQRLNNHEDEFEIGMLDANVGLSYRKNRDTFTLAAQGTHLSLDNRTYRRAHGINAQWQRDINNKNQLNAFAQVSRLEYPDNEIRDADRYVAGGGWAHVFNGDLTPLLFVSGYLGKEETRDRQWDFLSNRLYGIRSGGQLTLKPKLVAFTTMGYEYRTHDGQEPLFLKDRIDRQLDVSLGLRYLPGYNWVIKPQLTYIRNESNIDLNDFDRYMVSVSVRREFNW
ncbi:tetratricopeptide repeat protein [Methylobacillus arboreus]|uniref:surface lipoprotein assembly modifier n=1 Tax=Methylobacillus arboreus TaxID=755170 RepID=UPI001E5CE798|nr:surface lipoprotein assembly modifier [Methylobacillus arboreus]MCB5191817.1 tetratricopeptide repeat protein [Methylobacillus arboreus]